MDRDQAKALLDRLNSDPEMQEILSRTSATCPRGAALAALGAPYRLAGREIPPPSLAGIARLGLIRSPLLAGAEELAPMDAWRALCALISPEAKLASLYGLDAEVAAIRRIGKMAKLGDEAIARLIGEAERRAFAPIDREAAELAAQYPGASSQDVADLIARMLSDVMAAFGRVPKGDAAENPTNRPAASTATGSGRWRWWHTLRGWILSLPCICRRPLSA